MAQKETQVKYKEGEGDLKCAHPNIQHSELKKKAETERREAQENERNASAKEALKKWHAAKYFEKRGDLVAAADCMKKFEGSKANVDGKEFEQKVAEETDAQWTSIQFKCPDCGMSGDIDVVTDDGRVKECKISASAASEGQYNKIVSASAAIFGAAAPVHMALPAGEAAGIGKRFAQNMKGKVQKH